MIWIRKKKYSHAGNHDTLRVFCNSHYTAQFDRTRVDLIVIRV